MVRRLLFLSVCSTLFACSGQTEEAGPHGSDVGFVDCDRYLTEVLSDGFCQDTRPADWREFRFNGETYFIVPLNRL